MRILYSVDYYQPKLGYSEYFVPQELKKMGHKVIILTSNFFYPFPDYENTAGKILGKREHAVSDKTEDGIRVIREKLKYEIFTRAIIGNHEKYLQLFNPDLVIVNKSAGYNAIRFAQLKHTYHYKLISYDAHLPSGFYAEGNLFLKKLFYFAFRILYSRLLNRNTDKFIAVQEKTEEIMKQYYGLKKIVHIPLGTDTSRFYFDSKIRDRFRKKYNIPEKAFVAIYTGKVIDLKGVHLLFDAFSKLSKKHSNIYLLIVGEGAEEYKERCKQYITPQEQKKVIWAGFQDNKELYKYYSMADVGVWPLQESTAMNDAAACRLPFIANNTIGARVRLSNNNALLYKMNDSKDLARQIEYLYLNPKIRKQMGINGLELIEKKLSWKKVVQDYIHL